MTTSKHGVNISPWLTIMSILCSRAGVSHLTVSNFSLGCDIFQRHARPHFKWKVSLCVLVLCGMLATPGNEVQGAGDCTVEFVYRHVRLDVFPSDNCRYYISRPGLHLWKYEIVKSNGKGPPCPSGCIISNMFTLAGSCTQMFCITDGQQRPVENLRVVELAISLPI